MSLFASKALKIAEAEIGYLEKASNKNLDDKTANAGSKNYTKYARDLYKAGYYQGNKNGYAWCDVFFDWVIWKLCGEDAVKAQEITCQTGPYGAGCTNSAQYYKQGGRFHTSNPQPGDQIFFWDAKKTSAAHTGIVDDVDDEYIYTIEGNTSGASGVVANGGGVFYKRYKRDYHRIYGYGRPKYDAETQKEEVCTVNVSVLKKGSKGKQVRALQALLVGYGYSCGSSGVDGSFGSATDKAVRNYQKAMGLSVDGSVGPQTWAKLLGV